MDAIAWIAEQKIQEAIATGELDDLPGMGKPLSFEDEDLHSEHWLANKILRNAGLLPYPMQLRKDIERQAEEARRCILQCRNLLHQCLLRLHSLLSGAQAISETVAPSLTRQHGKMIVFCRNFETCDAFYHLSKKDRRSLKNITLKINHLIERYNCRLREYRNRYMFCLLQQKAKTEELAFYQVKEEIQHRMLRQQTRQPLAIDVAERLRCFDDEFDVFTVAVE